MIVGWPFEMSYVLSIDGFCISHGYLLYMSHVYEMSNVFQVYLPTRSYMWEMSHVFLSYLPKRSYVLPIDGSFISWLFT